MRRMHPPPTSTFNFYAVPDAHGPRRLRSPAPRTRGPAPAPRPAPLRLRYCEPPSLPSLLFIRVPALCTDSRTCAFFKKTEKAKKKNQVKKKNKRKTIQKRRGKNAGNFGGRKGRPSPARGSLLCCMHLAWPVGPPRIQETLGPPTTKPSPASLFGAEASGRTCGPGGEGATRTHTWRRWHPSKQRTLEVRSGIPWPRLALSPASNPMSPEL